MSTRQRSGFTVVELLVVIAIIGIIVGLVMPAVMSARERARQIECNNNLRNLAIAANSFIAAKSRFPGSQELLLPLDPASVPPSAPGYNKPASWFVMLLPSMGRNDLGDRWLSPSTAFEQPVLRPGLAFAKCPSASDGAGLPATTQYVANAGFFPRGVDGAPLNNVGYLAAAQRPANGLFLDRITNPRWTVRSNDVVDGGSNTIMLSENLAAVTWDSFGPLDPRQPAFPVNHGWSRDLSLRYHLDGRLGAFPPGARFRNTIGFCFAREPNGPAVSPLPNGRFVTPESPVPGLMKINGERFRFGEDAVPFAEIARPSSRHRGGALAAMVDGSVRFLYDEIEYHVYQQLLTPRGRMSDMPCRVSYVLSDEDY